MEKDQYRSQFRLPYPLYEKLKAASTEHGKSLNGELVDRLERSLSNEAVSISEEALFAIGLLSASIQVYVASLDRDKIPEEQRKFADTLEQVARAVYEKLPKQQPTT